MKQFSIASVDFFTMIFSLVFVFCWSFLTLAKLVFLFQVSQNGLDVVGLLIERLGSNFRPYLNTVLGPAVDRLGDTRETVRDKAHYLITKLMEEEVMDPQPLFEKMQNGFTHKNGKVREEILVLLQNTLNV